MFAMAATPFDHTGAVYRTKVQHNFGKWRRTSLAGFVVGSPAGEGPLLSAEEKVEILKLAADAESAAPSSLLIGDVTQEGVAGAVKLAGEMADAGAHAIISRAPSEYRHLAKAEESQTLYFRALADQSRVPVVIHNAPGTGVDLKPAAIAKLAEHPNIAGVVEGSADVARIAAVRGLAGKDFGVLTSNEGRVWESLAAGASGAALAFASAAPYATIAIWEAFRTREEEAGIDWQGRIAHPSLLVTDIHGPAGLKHAMDLNGYYGGLPRLPLVPVEAKAKLEIEEAFRDLKG